MGVDTKGYISKEVGIDNLYEFVTTNFDKDAEIFGRSNSLGLETCYILFEYKEEKRQIFVMEYAGEEEKYMFNGEGYTHMSLGHWGSSEEIMTKIVMYYGGWYLHNDCCGDDPVLLMQNKKCISDDKVGKDISEHIGRISKLKEIVGSFELAKRILDNETEILEILKGGE